MNQAILMDAYVDKGTEISDVRDDTGQLHALDKVVNRMYMLIEIKFFQLLTRVTTGLLKLFHDVGESGKSHFRRYILAYVDSLLLVFILNKLLYGAALVLGHLLHNVITLRMDGRVVERILGFGQP